MAFSRNSTFPTSKERLAWRVCSAATIALPPVIISLVLPSDFLGSNQADWMIEPALYLTTALYALGRITLIVLALISLRALPADAFQIVNWNNHFPQFAA